MQWSRVAFTYMLILALVPAISVVPAQVLSQSSATLTTQVTTTKFYTYPFTTQYASSTETSYVYGPNTFTINASSTVFCYDWRENFNATKGQRFHIEWTSNFAQTPKVLDLYIATPSAVAKTWYCDTGPEALYFRSNAIGSVDWVAPSAGQYIALLVNNNPNYASGTLSIETYAIMTVSSVSYATETSTNLVETAQIVTAGSTFIPGSAASYAILIGVLAALSIVGFTFYRRRSAATTAAPAPETLKTLPPPVVETEPTPPPALPQATAAPTTTEVIQPTSEKRPIVSQQAGPISTGYAELDQMLSGGLPDRYAILFASPSYDERDLLLGKIIESNSSSGNPSFYISSDVRKIEDLLGKYPHDFFAFCQQADKVTPGHANLFNVASIENLSDFNISLTTSLRTIPTKEAAGKIMIIDFLSDVLLQHKLLTTRRWLSDFLTRRKAEGFTVLATFNPLIAAREEAQTIIDSFDGVIEIYEKELKERSRRFLTIKKMYGRRYAETELMLDKNRLY